MTYIRQETFFCVTRTLHAMTQDTSSPPSSTRGAQRRLDILSVARSLLVEEGYGEFSVRKVAQKAGIRLSNLQYYFPTREALVQALFAQMIQDRVATPGQPESVDPEQVRQGMLVALSRFIKHHQQREHQIFLRELWALATHDPAIAQVMQEFYHQWIDRIAGQLQRINPRLSLPEAERRALLIISLVDGLSLFHGGVGLRHRANEGIETDVVQWVLKLAEE